MEIYNDFAISPQSFEEMAKEYSSQMNSGALSVKASEVESRITKKLFNNIEYLRVLISDLKSHTTNRDVLIVLSDVSDEIEKQNSIFKSILQNHISALEDDDVRADMFCNNLKLTIQTAGEIIKILVEIKDSANYNVENKPVVTEIINAFVDINNSLVSLFGECRYMRYTIRKN